jgi:hypothetical protein
VLGDIGVRPRGGGVRAPITWQSVALGDVASVEPVIPELCDAGAGSAWFVLEIPL